MVDPDLITAKLADLQSRIERVRARCPESAEALANDRDALDLVSFNLLLAVQACLDIGSHIIADEGWEPAQTLAGTFRRLHEHQVLQDATSRALAEAAGLRNVVAHGYAGVDPDRVYRAATDGLHDLEAFAQQVASWVRSQEGGGRQS